MSTSRSRIRPVLATAVLCCTLAAQDAGDVSTLIEAVAAAHRPGGATATIRAFRDAEIRILPRGKAEQTAEVVLYADFSLPGYLRYRVQEGDTVFERGVDRRGPWSKQDGKLLNLLEKEYEVEGEVVRQHLQLARQLVRFLDPAAVLRSLREPTAITAESMRYRGEVLPTRKVSGLLDDFPRFFAAGKPGGVRLTVWVHAETDRLFQVEARPLPAAEQGAGDPEIRDDDLGELLVFEDYVDRDGIMLPTKLLVCRLTGERPRPELSLTIPRIELGADLDREHFARSR